MITARQSFAWPNVLRRSYFVFAIVIAVVSPWSSGHAAEKLQPGSRYKVVGPLYLSGIYRDLNDRKLDRLKAYGSLTAVQFSGPEVAFQRAVPVGTIVTILGPAPKRLPLSFLADRYFVQLAPIEPKVDLQITLQLDRGIEGSLDGLNPELFRRLN